MVFQYYHVPDIGFGGDYQCGIVALYGATYDPNTGTWSGPCLNNCYACVVGAAQFQTIQVMLLQYPQFADYFTGTKSAQPIASVAASAPLLPDQVVEELDAGRPIITALAPSSPYFTGPPTHVALIVGYVQLPNELDVIVNDPFPYEDALPPGVQDPYLAAGGRFLETGRYQIEIRSFVYGLSWSQSAYEIAPMQPAQTTPPPPPPPAKSSSGGGIFSGALSWDEVMILAVIILLGRVGRRA